MPKQLIEQPDYVPTRKVGLGQAAASVVTILAYFVEEYSSVEIPLFIGTAILQCVMFGIQYFVRDRGRTDGGQAGSR